MATRYWVGGTGTWDSSSTVNWASSSGGASGASAPTSADDVVFDNNSDSSAPFTVTISTGAVCKNISFGTGGSALDQTMTLAGSAAWSIYGSLTFPATNLTRTYTGAITFASTTTGNTITTNGVTLTGGTVTFNGVGGAWSLGSALTTTSTLLLTNGSFDTANYNLTFTNGAISSNNTNTRTLTLGSSTVTINRTSAGSHFTVNTTNLTFNAGTSTVIVGGTSTLGQISIAVGPITFYNFTTAYSGSQMNLGFTSSCSNFTFNNLTIGSVSGATGYSNSFYMVPVTTQGKTFTVNGTFTANSGSTITNRLFIGTSTPTTNLISRSAVNTINAASVSLTNVDFQDTTATGAATWSGTNLGNAGNNSGITFPSSKTVYWNNTAGGTWSSNSWATSSGGAVNTANFPLAQDNAIFNDTGLNVGNTITLENYSVNSIDFSGVTKAITLSTGTTEGILINGNFSLSSSITMAGTRNLYFTSSSSSSITAAGQTFLGGICVLLSSSGNIGTLSLGSNITTTNSTTGFVVASGVLSLGSYTFSCYFLDATSASASRTISFGTGKIICTGNDAGSGIGQVFSAVASPTLSITGQSTGSISFTSSSTKTFNGAGNSYPVIDQNGAGLLNIWGNNTFYNITNSYSSIGATSVKFFAGSSNTFSNGFNLTGTVGKVCTLGSTSTSQATLTKSAAWNVGANSTNGGNNTGLVFGAGGGIDYLSISYINGALLPQSSSNFLMFF